MARSEPANNNPRYAPYQSAAEPHNGSQFFRPSVAKGSGVCAICLGSHENLSKCRSKTLWNRSPARCYRDQSGKLSNPQGINICLEFQRAKGCQGSRYGPRHIHECSGCGSPHHGASSCPSRQKL
ncbi:hypothetical protein R3P38DRAFT_2561857 [Favolaschia claudopus]|uniref:Uncharacterized protein n=1 Tax=Favolaschia claudopus TaxID=2862362 RepID=A0AAW0A320_9AGAR